MKHRCATAKHRVKIVNFADRTRHQQLFLEPEVETNEYYLNGFSSSLPIDHRSELYGQSPHCEMLQLYRPGYAISEYDFFDPRDLHHTLESSWSLVLPSWSGQRHHRLRRSGQGLLAGINAALALQGNPARPKTRRSLHRRPH